MKVAKKPKLPILKSGMPVSRDSMGSGVVTRIVDRSSHNVEVKWDSGEGPFFYTYNHKEQEIAPA